VAGEGPDMLGPGRWPLVEYRAGGGIANWGLISTGETFSTGGNFAHGDLAGAGARAAWEECAEVLSTGPFGS